MRALLGELGLAACPKTSRGKGPQVDVPLDGEATYAQAKPGALGYWR